MQVRQALTDAARAGARRSVAPYTQTSTLAPITDFGGQKGIKTVVKEYLSAASITVNDSQIQVDQNIGATTKYTRVSVTYPYKVTMLKLIGFSTINLVGSSLMRNETSP